MALNPKNFITRTITAIVFAAVMLAGLLWNHWSFLILLSIIHFGCWWEYISLIEKIHNTSFHINTRLGFMLLGFGIMLWFCGQVYEISDYGIKQNFSFPVSVAGFILLGVGIFQRKRINLKAFGVSALGLLYISLSWGFMIDLGNFIDNTPGFSFYSVIIPCAIVFSIWTNDTMAYIVGSLIGRTPLSKISPKKTWEGTIGGILLCIIVIGTIFSNFSTDIGTPGYHSKFSNQFWFILAAIASVSGTIGDLLESWLKRMAKVKDSGSFMPGHGGFLDRFDSMLLAIPPVWIYVKFFISNS